MSGRLLASLAFCLQKRSRGKWKRTTSVSSYLDRTSLVKKGFISGVPNERFSQHWLYNVVNASRVLLRQPMLIFNFPGKKIPLFTASQQDFQKIKIPASNHVWRFFCQPARLKKNKKLRNPSQRETEFGVCQLAVVQASYERASRVSFNTHCHEKHKSQQARSVLRQIYII